MLNGGDGEGSVKVDIHTVTTGGEVTINAPPGSTLIVHEEGTATDVEIAVDDSGKVKVPAGNQSRDLVIYLKSNPSMWASASVIDVVR